MNGLTMELEIAKYTGWSVEEVRKQIAIVASAIPDGFDRVRHFLSLAVPVIGWGDAVKVIQASPGEGMAWYAFMDLHRVSLCFGGR